MTDIWDELWKNMPVVVYGLRGGKSTHADWLTKVKAEGDRLKEKAEKFDYWQSQDPTSVEWLIEYRALKDKLETVKAHLEAVFKKKSILDQWTWSINPISFDKLMANLYKVLEGEG